MTEKVVLELVLDKSDADKILASLPNDFDKAGKKSGKEFGEEFNKSTKESLSSSVFKGAFLANLATEGIKLAGRAIREVTSFMKESVAAAQVQQDAVNSLNASLAQTGSYSAETSKDLQDFASGLQSATRFADEAIISQLSFAQAMGASASQSKDILAAAADMSSALNIDLNAAVRNITKTLGGYSGELGEVIPELKNLTQEQLRAGEGVKLLSEKFKGFAEKDVKTFSGSVKQLSNVFGDSLLENFGKVITNSPSVVLSIGFITKELVNLGKTISESLTNGSIELAIQNLIIKTADFGVALISNVLIPFRDAVLGFEVSFKALAIPIAYVAGLVSGGLSGALEAGSVAIDTFKESLDSSISDGALERLEKYAQAKRDALTAMIEENAMTGALNAEKIQNTTATNDALIAESNRIEAEEKRRMAQKVATGKQFQAILTATTQNSLVMMGKNLATGENFFKGFLGIVINAIADMAIAWGMGAIAIGVAAEGLKASFFGLTGIPAMVAGASAIVAGGVLKGYAASLGGGGAGAPSAAANTSGVGGSNAFGDNVNVVGTSVNPEETKQQQVVNLTIQGDVLDSDASGMRILQLLNDSFESSGTRLVTI